MKTPTPRVRSIVREGIFFLAFFLYLWLRINPALFNQRGDPLFLIDGAFLTGFLAYPGGLTDLVAALLAQLFYYPVLGAAVITASVWAITRLTSSLIRTINPEYNVRILQYLPAVAFIIIQSDYRHTFNANIALIAALAAIVIFYRSSRKIPIRVIIFFLLGISLYYIAGGIFLLFAVMCMLHEAIALRRPVVGALYLAAGWGVPLTAEKWLFLLNDRMAFLHLLPFEQTYSIRWTPYLLTAFFLLLPIALHPPLLERIGFSNRLKFRHLRIGFTLQTLLLAGASACAAYFSFEKNNNLLLQVDYYARHEQWNDILRTSRQDPSDLLQVAFCTNRALYHTGQLLEDMFSYPQTNGAAGLMLPKQYSESGPLQESDFCYELGSINESRHWAYEAVSTEGETPWTLKRMATVNYLSGDTRAAERCLNELDKTLFFRSWAKEFRKVVDDSTLADSSLRQKQAMIPSRDYIVISGHPPTELDTLLAMNPMNKMAFEYRIAHQLLTCRLGGFLDHVVMIRNFNYPHLPRHIEEAVLSVWLLTHPPEVPSIVKSVRPETFERFKQFNIAFAKFNGNRRAARAEIQKRFGDTFWYYMLYNNPVLHAIEQPSRKGGME